MAGKKKTRAEATTKEGGVASPPRPVKAPYRRVLCATDLSPTGDSAVALAYRLTAEGGTVTLLHVHDSMHLEPPRRAVKAKGAATAKEVVEAVERQARDHVEALPYRSGRPDVTSEQVFVRHPNAAAAIERQAEETGADAIVLGTRGRTGLGRILMGSVATAVLKRAKVPVVLYHDPAVRD
jgi:nucleotide-binding universal stress UspA family protein